MSQQGNLRLELSPDERWIWMTGDQLIYIMQPGDDIRGRDGEKLAEGTLLRVTYKDADPTGTLIYQYRFTRIAYKRPDGTVPPPQAACAIVPRHPVRSVSGLLGGHDRRLRCDAGAARLAAAVPAALLRRRLPRRGAEALSASHCTPSL